MSVNHLYQPLRVCVPLAEAVLHHVQCCLSQGGSRYGCACASSYAWLGWSYATHVADMDLGGLAAQCQAAMVDPVRGQK